jgi:3-methyl-2-oxobutanoate hydroxymethyltransferase
MSNITLHTLNKLKANGEKFAMVTAYDATQARLADQAGIESLLVGDSLGNVIQGQQSTLPVDIEDMAYHTLCVASGNQSAFIISDMPFMSYATPEAAMDSAAVLMQAGAHAVKLEGGAWLEETVAMLTTRGIPVCAHLGLMPQSVNKTGGYRVQGRDADSAKRMIDDAKRLQEAGADFVLLEMVPAQLAAEITRTLTVPVIGIGAGNQTDAQVLVFYDLLGMTEKPPSFVKNFLRGSVQETLSQYATEVRSGAFPDTEHTPA